MKQALLLFQMICWLAFALLAFYFAMFTDQYLRAIMDILISFWFGANVDNHFNINNKH